MLKKTFMTFIIDRGMKWEPNLQSTANMDGRQMYAQAGCS